MFDLEVIGRSDAKQTVPAQQLADAIRSNRGGVRLIHAVVEGAVDLSSVRFDHELVIRDCNFQGHFDACGARFGNSVDLGRCVFQQNLDFQGARVEGSLILSGSEIRRGGPPPGAVANSRHADDTASFALIRIQGHLAAESLTSLAKLTFSCARVGGDATFTTAQLAGGLNLEVAVIEGSLNCGRIRLKNSPPDPWSGATVEDGSAMLGGIKVHGQVNFRGAVIEKDLVLYSAIIQCGLRCGADGEQRTEIGGDALFTAAEIAFGAEFGDARIAGNLNFQDAEVDGDLICQRTEIIRRAKPVPDEGGNAHLSGLTVSGLSDFRGARIANDLYLQSAVLRGGIYCRAFEPQTPDAAEGVRTTVGRNVWMAAATVQGGVDLSGTEVGGDFSLDGADVEGGLFCRPWRLRNLPTPPSGGTAEAYVPTHIQGSALLAAAHISGVVDFAGARIEGNLNLESADIRNGLFCKPLHGLHTLIGGRALLNGIKIAGVADFSGAEVRDDLNLEGAEIANGLLCKQVDHRPTTIGNKALLTGARISGGVDLAGIRVHTDLNLEGAHLDGKLNLFSGDKERAQLGGDALFGGLNVSGGVNLNRTIMRDLRLQGAHIDGKLNCKHAHLSGSALLNEIRVSGQIDFGLSDIRGDLNLQGANIEGRLSCQRTKTAGKVDLRACAVRNADLDFGQRDDPPRADGRTWPTVRIEGFQFQELTIGDKDRGRSKDYLELLRSSQTFEVSTYFLIERWLRNRGEDEQANNIYLAMRGERRRHSNMGPVARWVDSFFDVPIFLALRFKYLFFLFFASLLLTTLIFSSSNSVQMKDPPAGEPAGPPVEWTLVDAFWMSMQVNLPMTRIPVAEKWELSSKPILCSGVNCWVHYDYYGSLISLFGYVAVPLFMAGVANTWLRQKSAGGE